MRLSRCPYSIFSEGTGEGAGDGSFTFITRAGGLGGGSDSRSHTRSGRERERDCAVSLIHIHKSKSNFKVVYKRPLPKKEHFATYVGITDRDVIYIPGITPSNEPAAFLRSSAVSVATL